MTRGAAPLRSVTFVGRGKVGTALGRAARAAGIDTRVVGSRGSLRLRPSDLFVLAVSDRASLDVAAAVGASGVAPSAIVHTAGLLPPDHLATLRPLGWAVGQAHPLLSFAGGRAPLVAGATVLVGGDGEAVARCRALVRALGLRSLVADVDRDVWHAVAALVANGAAALAALGAARWVAAGVPEVTASRALGSLLASVAANVAERGGRRALSGPVRRGDALAVARHLDVLARGGRSARGPAAAYAAMALAQLDVAEAIGEADPAALRRIERLARDVVERPRRRRRPRAAGARA